MKVFDRIEELRFDPETMDREAAEVAAEMRMRHAFLSEAEKYVKVASVYNEEKGTLSVRVIVDIPCEEDGRDVTELLEEDKDA